jgi:hypothetical protein
VAAEACHGLYSAAISSLTMSGSVATPDIVDGRYEQPAPPRQIIFERAGQHQLAGQWMDMPAP